MNCPYCNNKCIRLILTFKCKNCCGSPEFLQWNANVFLTASIYSNVVFFNNSDKKCLFYPQDYTIYIVYLDLTTQLQYLVTPDNIEDTLKRFFNLKSFI